MLLSQKSHFAVGGFDRFEFRQSNPLLNDFLHSKFASFFIWYEIYNLWLKFIEIVTILK